MEKENIMTSPIDPAILNDPELIRQRKEARRNMTDAERQRFLTQAAERAFQEHYEKFKRETFELAHRQAMERRNKAAAKKSEQ